MVTTLDKVDVVTVGVGWTGGIIAAEATKAGLSVMGWNAVKSAAQKIISTSMTN